MKTNQKLLLAGEIVVNSEAFDNLCILCDQFNSRFFGTPEAKSAADFISNKFKEYGLSQVEVEPAEYYGWKNGSLSRLWNWKRVTASLDILEPIKKKLNCISMANTPSTPKNGVTAEIVVLESSTKKYLVEHKKRFEGKLVLDGAYTKPGDHPFIRDSNYLSRSSLYGFLEQSHAAGMIYSNRYYGNLVPTGGARFGTIGKIPACGIARETLDYILRYLKGNSVIANLKIKNEYALGATAYNVIAEIPGYKYPNQVILIGGHFDSHDIAPGAMDDAAGACVVMEAARALAKHGGPLKRTLRFCCFDAEELGLIGSTGYIINHLKDLKKICLMINTDAAGISAKSGHGFVVNGSEALVTYLEATLNSLGKFDRHFELPKVTNKISNFSDHWPFYVHGIPTAKFHDIPVDPRDMRYSHTTADTVDKVDAKGLKDASLLLALCLLQIANEETLPFNHQPIGEIQKRLEENGIAENLKMAGLWRREFPP